MEHRDSGLLALLAIARINQLPVDERQLKHRFAKPGESFSDTEIIRAAKALGLKASKLSLTFAKLQNQFLPAIIKTGAGEYAILAKVLPANKDGEGKALILRPGVNQPEQISQSELERFWSGESILLTKREGVLASFKGFDIKWFIPALLKYKKLFAEVILISFFLQLFALATPLFFQVVMDKVLVHRGFTTLDVLAFAFVAIAIFDAILGGVRNYLFSHTANRVDVELGARLFQHLVSLPLSYFESRQVGQSVARVRELDTIRNFITSTALTLLIDLFFTVVFFMVMWFYSPTLTIIVMLSLPFYVALSIFITPILRHRLDLKFCHGAKKSGLSGRSRDRY